MSRQTANDKANKSGRGVGGSKTAAAPDPPAPKPDRQPSAPENTISQCRRDVPLPEGRDEANSLSRCRAILPADSTGKVLASTLSAQATGLARLEAFRRIFQGDDRVLVIISADPDAVASAVAVKRLLWRRASQVTVASVNQVKRPDNLSLLEALRLKMEPLSSVDVCDFTRLVMVDSQPYHSPQTRTLRFDAVIDHHPPSLVCQNPPPAFVDIRPDLGATATMMSGYLKAAKITPNRQLATALFYAIKTDTQNFVRQGQLEDMRFFRWLYPYIHPDLLSSIERAPIAKSSFKAVVAGLSGVVFDKNMARTFLGRTDHADTLVIVADFLMKVHGVNRSLAAGICDRKLVIILRAGGLRQDMGKLAKAAFDEFGSAGGHRNMARAEIPLDRLDPKIRDNPPAINRFLLRRLAGAAGGRPKK
ncbi:DHH family phosphoesterase [Deltaproteobacteria bacterium OttesenSCG-928-M10]|nr:DHH family phosphoesterase [Deltaproteobacteria bacterium OttesenSCG-928-M10]